MDMSEATYVRPFQPHPKDPIRPDRVRTIEVECAVESCVLPHGGYIVTGPTEDNPTGLNTLDVRESDIPLIMDQIADPASTYDRGHAFDRGDEVRTDPAKIDRAKKRFEEGRAEHLRVIQEKNPGHPIEWKDVALDYDGPRSWVELYCNDNFPLAAGIYKSVKPLRRVKVISDAKAPPLSDAEMRAKAAAEVSSQAQTDALVAAVLKLREIEAGGNNNGGNRNKGR